MSGSKSGDSWEGNAWAGSSNQIYLTYPHTNGDMALASDSQGTFNAHYRFFNLRSTTTYKGVRQIDGQSWSHDNNFMVPVYYPVWGFLDAGSAASYDTKVDGLVFSIGYGYPFVSGTLKLYGWKK